MSKFLCAECSIVYFLDSGGLGQVWGLRPLSHLLILEPNAIVTPDPKERSSNQRNRNCSLDGILCDRKQNWDWR